MRTQWHSFRLRTASCHSSRAEELRRRTTVLSMNPFSKNSPFAPCLHSPGSLLLSSSKVSNTSWLHIFHWINLYIMSRVEISTQAHIWLGGPSWVLINSPPKPFFDDLELGWYSSKWNHILKLCIFYMTHGSWRQEGWWDLHKSLHIKIHYLWCWFSSIGVQLWAIP